MHNVPFAARLSCAIHIANLVIREEDANHNDDADRAQNRLADYVEAQPEGDVFLVALARKLGRKRAKRVNIDKQTIEVAARLPADVVEDLIRAGA